MGTDLESKLSILTEILKRDEFDIISFSVELTKTREPDKRVYLEVSETMEQLTQIKHNRLEYVLNRMLGGLIGHLEPGLLYELEHAKSADEARKILMNTFPKSSEQKKPLNAVIDNDGRLLTGLDAHRKMRDFSLLNQNKDEI